MPTHQDNMISMDKTILLYCNIEEILVNVGKIICEHIQAWVRHPHDARPLPNLIEQIFLKACFALKNLLKTMVKDEICTITSVSHMINLNKNKAEDKCLKTKEIEKVKEDDKMEIDEEEEREDETLSPLIRKMKGENKAFGSRKRKRKPKAKDSRDLLPLANITSPAA
ncbi:hypothetical protein E5676_scaffold76994G00060 [Cucumis melo var. makuwa]|uniref:Uncharacterized protein n=2 Tax=Cucumis melo TaxID=3656 RepID=A0A5D3C0C3_CUCMM|nr:hypothetical protein E6C27_scaffold409G001210 [Cucumis melo var. makuwa]TYK04704.1 hypothetical protein E5676_scaffold76994G00060 [Cucumis melo var. makuwa]